MRQIVAGSAALCLAVAACGGGGNDDAGSPGPTGGTTTSAPAGTPSGPPVTLSGTVNDKGTKDLAGDDELALDLGDFYFGPTYVKAAPGATVKVELTNSGQAPHTFTIDDPKVDVTVKAGEDGTATVKLPASGPLAFYCTFHKAQGMQGAFYFAPGGSAGSTGSTPSGTASGDDGGAYNG
jgi:plastocyanin